MAKKGVEVPPLPLNSSNLLSPQFGGFRRDTIPILFLNIVELLFYLHKNSNPSLFLLDKRTKLENKHISLSLSFPYIVTIKQE